MSTRKAVLTTGEVARICQVAPRTVSKWFDSGQLKGYRVPGSKDRRIPVEDLIRFMRDNGLPLRGLTGGLKRVLVVTPDGGFGDSLKAALEQGQDFECEQASSAFGAGLLAARLEPDVIMVDTTSPELRKAVSAHRPEFQGEEGIKAKLIAMTSSPETVAMLEHEGFAAAVVRPFKMDDVVPVIQRVLDQPFQI